MADQTPTQPSKDSADTFNPHPVLDQYYDSAEKRETKVQEMFDRSAIHYDWITKFMSFGSGRWYRKQALLRAGFEPGMKILDVGAGTGEVSLCAQEIVGDEGEVLAVDPSPGMLGVAKEAGVLNTVIGKGEDLPAESDYYDRLSMGYALRHVADLKLAFAEYKRVLKPGGKLVLLEITRPKNRLQYYWLKFYLKYIIPIVTRIFRRSADAQELMAYYWDTIEQCVPPEKILQALEDVGLQDVERYVEMGVFSEYRATKPEQSTTP